MTEGPLLVASDLADYRAGNVDLNLAAAVEAVRGYCRWHIAPVRTEEMTLDAVNGCVILPTLRATAVAVVDAAGVTVDPSNYQLEDGYLLLTTPWLYGRLAVTLTHGYDTLPADVKKVALSMADSGTAIGGRLVGAGPFSYEFPDGSADAEVLDRYRLASRP